MKQDSNTEKKKRGKKAKRYKKLELENDQKKKKQKAKYDFKIQSVYTVSATALHYLIKFSQQPCNRI